MPKAWFRPLLGVVLFLGLAAPAQADIRTGGVDDAIGDGPVTLGGERRGDVKRVDAEYDEQAGKIKVTFKLRETLPRYYSSTVSASIAQSSAGGKCSYGGTRGDITIQGHFYRYYYNDEIYSNVYVNGVGIAQSTGVGSVDFSRTELTISAQGFPIANLPYQCLTGIRQSESYSSASNEDVVSDFFFDDVVIPPPIKREPFIVIPGAPSLSPTTAQPGDTLTATTRYENRGNATGVIKVANQTIRRPGQPHTRPAIWDGDFSNRIRDRSLAAGDSITQTGTLKLKSNAPPGRWEIYSSWQDSDGVWHDSVSGYFTVEAPPVTPVVTPTPTDDSPAPTPAPAPAPGNPSPPPGAPKPSQGSPTQPVTAPRAPAIRFNVDATARRQSLVRVLRSGVRVAGKTPRSGRIAVSLYRGRTKVGSGSIKARKRGSYSATIRLSARGKQVLRRRAGSIVVEARRTRRDTDATTVRVLR